MKVAFFFEFTEVGIQIKCKGHVYCSFRCSAPFCSLCCPLRPLLLIGGKLSTAYQDPPINGFKVQHREQNGVHHLKEQQKLN